MRAFSASFLKASIATIAGYPGDLGTVYQYGMAGYLSEIEERLLRYKLDTNGGQSGSGIMVGYGGRTYLAGVHRGSRDTEFLWWGSDTNVGPRITAARFNQIRDWVRTKTHTYEVGRDRHGSDYKGFELATPDYRSCMSACSRESRCAAWTYVKPGVQGARARCWLKSSVPRSTANSKVISGVKFTVEPGFDYAGGDYKGVALSSTAAPTTCRSLCLAEVPRCRAWTFVLTGFQGSTPRCWLKEHVNPVQNLDGTITGLVGGH